jgi:hypothetical protein
MPAMTGLEYVERLARDLGVEPPDAAEVTALLDLAGVAAHASERIAAPLACWLVGRAGADPAAVLARMRADET